MMQTVTVMEMVVVMLMLRSVLLALARRSVWRRDGRRVLSMVMP